MKLNCLWIIGLGVASALAGPVPPDPEDAAYPAIQRFVEVLDAVRKRHPDADLVAYDRLVNHALEGMLAGLDPHSSFIHPEMAAKLKQDPQTNPDLPSLGMTVGLRDDGPYVAAVHPRGPAADAGVLPGSAVLEIDGQKLAGAELTDWITALRKPAGASTSLLLKSPASPRPERVKLIHRWVDERSVAESRLLDGQGKTGYLRLASFGPGCAREMESALDELEDKGMGGLVLDLRQNGGGDLNETVKILGLFVPPGTVVVTTRGREEDAVSELKTPARQRRKREYPVVVLIDRMSASASELTAGALQDLKRATIIGERSYGKGSVQNIIPMGGGTALRLTIATYHTPSGNTPHRKGITPDVVVELGDADIESFNLRSRADTLTPDQRKRADGWEDPAMKAALESLRTEKR